MNLKEYRCGICGKLLCKGSLNCKEDILEVKCKGCHAMSQFKGTDAATIRLRSVLIKKGDIPDPEKD